MAYRKKAARTAYPRSYGTRSGGRGRAPARAPSRAAPKRGGGGGRGAVKRAPTQTVRVELVYRDASEIARPQGVVETRKGSKPRL